MTTPTLCRRHALAWFAAAACLPAFAGPDLPGDSLYRLNPHLTDQDGHPFALDSVRGGPVLISMFYSSCEMVCPVLFETIAQTLKALPAHERQRVKVLMISFDPARDTVAVLNRTADAHGCDARWTLLRTDDGNARKIAALLGVQYRRLASGEYKHSSTIELLDAAGRIAARSGLLGTVDPALVKALRQAFA